MNQYDYLDAGFRVLGLHGVENGRCTCGNPECTALYKHPILKNWARSPVWDDEQLENMELMGQFKTGFGVLCHGYLVVDVDPRNGGDIASLPMVDTTKAFTVQTGGGGLHVYYRAPEGVALVTHHDAHKGIDFKSSGFVVGAGSLHASGSCYEVLHGHPSDIGDAPAALVALLTRPAYFRASTSSGDVDVTLDELKNMLNHIDPDATYDEWIRVGMAIHHATRGSGFDLWDDWSKNGKKYSGVSGLEKHWHSFGKSANPAGLGTMIYYAEQGGYCANPVEFVSDVFFDDEQSGLDDLSDINPNMPPDFLGELTAWINSQCRYPLNALAPAVALQAVSVLAGSNFTNEKNPTLTPNIFTFCLAGSGCGKESLIGSLNAILRAGEKQNIIYGGFKSEQEIVRNLVRNSQSFYNIDEFGYVLEKVLNASKSGASYLETVISTVISIYGKGAGFFEPTGDIKDEIRKEIAAKISAERKINEKTGADNAEKIRELERSFLTADNGIEKPFLSLCGWSTPVTFDHLVTEKQATNGFIARSIIFKENETNPRWKDNFNPQEMPFSLKMTIGAISSTEKSMVSITPDASELLKNVLEYFWQQGEKEKERSGLEAIARRGYEIAEKIAFICAIPSGLMTVQHVKYGFAISKRDIENKIKLAYSNITEKTNPSDSVAVRISSLVTHDLGFLRSVIYNRMRGIQKSVVDSAIEKLLASGAIIEKVDDNSNKKSLKLFLNKA